MAQFFAGVIDAEHPLRLDHLAHVVFASSNETRVDLNHHAWANKCVVWIVEQGLATHFSQELVPLWNRILTDLWYFWSTFYGQCCRPTKKQKLKGTAPAARGPKSYGLTSHVNGMHALTISSSRSSLTFIFILMVSENENFHCLASGNTCMCARQHMISLAINSNPCSFPYPFLWSRTTRRAYLLMVMFQICDIGGLFQHIVAISEAVHTLPKELVYRIRSLITVCQFVAHCGVPHLFCYCA